MEQIAYNSHSPIYIPLFVFLTQMPLKAKLIFVCLF